MMTATRKMVACGAPAWSGSAIQVEVAVGATQRAPVVASRQLAAVACHVAVVAACHLLAAVAGVSRLVVEAAVVMWLPVVAVALRSAGVVQGWACRRSSSVGPCHSGTLPCLRRGNSSRLVANIRKPATSFWRVSAGSITSSM